MIIYDGIQMSRENTPQHVYKKLYNGIYKCIGLPTEYDFNHKDAASEYFKQLDNEEE